MVNEDSSLGPETVGPETVGSDTLGSETLGSDTLGSDTLGSDTLGSDTLGSDTLGSDTLGSDTLGSDTLGSDTLGSDTLGSDTLGSDTLGSVNRPSGMPGPVLAPINEGMWRAAGEGRLDVQRCANCGAHRYPPTDGCYRCASLEWTWSTLPGTGTIYTYMWVPDAARSEEKGEVLYNVVLVELDGTEGDPVRIGSNVLDAWNRDDLYVGQPVELACVPLGDGIGLPCFRRVA